MTLKRLVVTLFETRAILCFDPPEGARDSWLPVATLERGDGRDGRSAIITMRFNSKSNCREYSFLISPAGRTYGR